MDWNEKTEDTDMCVTCYGASKSFFLRDEKNLFNKSDFLRKGYASKATQMLEGVTVQDFKDKGCAEIKKYKCFKMKVMDLSMLPMTQKTQLLRKLSNIIISKDLR